MRASLTRNGLTVRVIAGTTSVIVGIDLQKDKRKGCLGFTIRRTDLGGVGQPAPAGAPIALPNMLKFPSDTAGGPITTERSPLQKFRWGDYTTAPAHKYRYQVVPRYGKPGQLQPATIGDGDGVSIEVTTEDSKSHDTSVFFNRAAAASRAFGLEFPNITSEELLLGQTADAQRARTWLSRGLEEACLAFLAQATGNAFALHAAVYEFQKPNLLAALGAARQRGVDVQVVFHDRQKQKKGKPDPSDSTKADNEAAIAAAGIGAFCKPRKADPQDAIMHDKFVVLLQKQGGTLTPTAVWTGSMNWTDGGVYGQLNVGHAVYDAGVAAQYEQLFQLLKQDNGAADQKKALKTLTAVPKALPPGHGILPIFSPQPSTDMADAVRRHLPEREMSDGDGAVRALRRHPHGAAEAPRGDGALPAARQGQRPRKTRGGPGAAGRPAQHDRGRDDAVLAAARLSGSAPRREGELLHTGIHIHSKIILADPFGSDPILVTGSANYSSNSTITNDENSLIVRGDFAVADIYVTEFMRMFEQYHFRAFEAAARKKAGKAAKPAKGGKGAKGAKGASDVLSLAEDDSWTDPFYVAGSIKELDRRMFAGTLT